MSLPPTIDKYVEGLENQIIDIQEKACDLIWTNDIDGARIQVARIKAIQDLKDELSKLHYDRKAEDE